MDNNSPENELDKTQLGMTSGDVHTSNKSEMIRKKVSKYNFKKALRFSKENVSVLHKLHEKFAREFSTVLQAKLRAPVEIEVKALKQVTFTEYVENIADNTVKAIMNTPPTDGQMLMDLSGGIAHCMIERMFGGTGFQVDKSKALTKIEELVMVNILILLADCKKRAWEPIVKPKIVESDIDVNPKNLYVFPSEETVIVANLKMKIGDIKGELNICLPYFILQPIAYKLLPSRLLAPKQITQEKTESDTLKTKIKSTLLSVDARLGEASINVEEFLNLSAGDVIRLNETIHDTVKVFVNGHPKFTGHPGIKRGKVSVQIQEEIEEGDQQ